MVSPRTRNLPRTRFCVVALVLHVDEPAEDGALVVFVAHGQGQDLLGVLLGRTQAINARHGSHDDHVAPGQQAPK